MLAHFGLPLVAFLSRSAGVGRLSWYAVAPPADAMSSDRPDESFAALFEKAGQAPPRGRGARVGQEVDTLVVQVGKDAVFVEYSGHRQGFIDTVDLRAADGTMTVAVGQSLRARVVHIDAEQGVRFVPAGIRLVPASDAGPPAAAVTGAAAGPIPTSGAASREPQAVKMGVGQVVSGLVQRVELYGVFLQVDGTKGRLGRGLVPTVELGVARGTDLRKAFPLGARLKAKILDLAEGKMRLSVRALKDDEERAQFEGFRETEKAAAPQTLGTLGDLLKRRK